MSIVPLTFSTLVMQLIDIDKNLVEYKEGALVCQEDFGIGVAISLRMWKILPMNIEVNIMGTICRY